MIRKNIKKRLPIPPRFKSKSPQESNKVKFLRQGLKTQFRSPFVSYSLARIQTACVFFWNNFVFLRKKQHFRFNLPTQFSESPSWPYHCTFFPCPKSTNLKKMHLDYPVSTFNEYSKAQESLRTLRLEPSLGSLKCIWQTFFYSKWFEPTSISLSGVSGCRNVSHQQQFFSELPSPRRSHNTNYKPLSQKKIVQEIDSYWIRYRLR